MAQGVNDPACFCGVWVPSPAQCSGSGVSAAMVSVTAPARIQSLAQELPCAQGEAKKEKRKSFQSVCISLLICMQLCCWLCGPPRQLPTEKLGDEDFREVGAAEQNSLGLEFPSWRSG